MMAMTTSSSIRVKPRRIAARSGRWLGSWHLAPGTDSARPTRRAGPIRARLPAEGPGDVASSMSSF